MKLLDKLAWEYSNSVHKYEYEPCAKEAYKAGFRAAREMAARSVEMDQKIIRAIKALNPSFDADLFDRGMKTRIDSMLNLGEMEEE